MVEFYPPDYKSINHIANNMREADRREIWASHHHTPLEALTDVTGFSTVAWLNGEPCAMFGVVICDILSGTGVPWLLGTDGVAKNYREFLRHSPKVIDDMIKLCPNLSNYVHVDNKLSIRWLKWLGFKFDQPVHYGIDKEIFMRFYIGKSNV